MVVIFRYRTDHMGRLMVDLVRNFTDEPTTFKRNSEPCYKFAQIWSKEAINQGYIEKLQDEVLDYD